MGLAKAGRKNKAEAITKAKHHQVNSLPSPSPNPFALNFFNG
jgi:hypothetical protein